MAIHGCIALIFIIDLSIPAYAIEPKKCEIKDVGSCQKNNEVVFRETCVIFIKRNYNWTSAIKTCHLEHMDLVTIGSSEKHAFLLGKSSGLTMPSFWIGLRYKTKPGPGKYVWQPTRHRLKKDNFQAFNSSSWFKGPVPPGSNCVLWSEGGVWIMEQCDIQYPIVCERPSQLYPDKPVISSDTHDVNSRFFHILEGDTLTLRCEANLRAKGKLNFVIVSKNSSQVISSSDSRVSYKEIIAPVPSQDHRCERRGSAEMTLRGSANLNGTKLACVSHIVGPVCSDKFCITTGSIMVTSVMMPSAYPITVMMVLTGLTPLIITLWLLWTRNKSAADALTDGSGSTVATTQSQGTESRQPVEERPFMTADKMSSEVDSYPRDHFSDRSTHGSSGMYSSSSVKSAGMSVTSARK